MASPNNKQQRIFARDRPWRSETTSENESPSRWWAHREGLSTVGWEPIADVHCRPSWDKPIEVTPYFLINPPPLNSCNRLNLIDRLNFYLAKGVHCIVIALYQMILASNTRAMLNIRLLRKTNIFDYFQDLDIQDRNLSMSDMVGIGRIVGYLEESNTMRSGRVGT